MDLLSTKTNPEREDEEADRLVRPAPKDKPPRRDRRREQMHVDKDSDKESDPDLSKNYKDIGGSTIAASLVLRWAKKKKIPVKNKETDKVVWVTQKTLQKEKGKYEPLKGEEAEKALSQKPRKPSAQPDEGASKSKVKPETGSTYTDLQDLAKGNEDVAKAFKALLSTDPMSLGSGVRNTPGMGDQLLSGLFPNVKFPKGLKTLGDLEKALQAGPGEPQKVEPEAEPQEAKPEAEKPAKKPKKPKDKKDKGKPKSKPKSEKDDADMAAGVARRWVEEKQHEQPEFQRFLDAIPTGDVDPMSGKVLVLDPETRKRVPFEELSPKAQKPLVNEFLKGQKQETAKARSKEEADKAFEEKKTAAEYVQDLKPEVREALEALADPNSDEAKKVSGWVDAGHDPQSIRVEKLFPDLRGKLPEDLESVHQATRIVQSAQAYDVLPEVQKAKVGEPKRREVSEEEQQKTLTYLMDNLPPEMATAMFERDIHPDDARTLVDSYREAKSKEARKKASDPVAFAKQVSDLYTDDPARVKPPKEWEGKPFADLPDEDKAEAMRQHQMKVVALSAAAKELLTESLSKSGGILGSSVPPVLASTLAGSMLMHKAGSSDKAKARQTQAMSQMVFDTAMSEGQHLPMSGRAIKSLMAKLDPHTQEVAKAFFQANDYHEAKDKFLKSGDEGLSEHGSVRSILKGLRKASSYMDEKAAVYGGGNVAQQLFRTRVMDKLRVLAPDKYAAVQARLDKDESTEYDRARKAWEKEHKAWLQRKEKSDKKAPKGAPYRGKPNEFSEPEPIEPMKPLRYNAHRKPSKKKGDALWDSVFGQTKTASRVVGRYQHTISIYPCGLAMGQRSRAAVYHGVEPDVVDPYPHWQPAHQRDLDEPDFQAILKSARKWLATPVLSRHVEGMIPDQQFRAALDYAIQTGIYNRAINPTLYNMLLARLAGWPEPGPEQTLLTIRGSTCEVPTFRSTAMTVKNADHSKYASDILGRIDKLAADIQTHHASWGMSMDEAKDVVNHLDTVADNFEQAAFGTESFENRRTEILAAVLQSDPDEPYMQSFRNIHQPVKTDADEPYMGAYNDDQSSAVETGKEQNGERLAP